MEDDLKGRQQLYQGFGDTLARGFELAMTPVIFGGGGWLLDRWLGITPVLTIVFVFVAVAGLGVKMYYGYEAAMQAHERHAAWAPRARPADRTDPSTP